MIKLLKRLLSENTRAEQGVCSICDQVFPDTNLTPIDELAFCPEHLEVYQVNTWKEFDCAHSNPENPEAALAMQNKKDELARKGVLSFIKTNYEHDDSSDEIITEFKLMTIVSK